MELVCVCVCVCESAVVTYSLLALNPVLIPCLLNQLVLQLCNPAQTGRRRVLVANVDKRLNAYLSSFSSRTTSSSCNKTNHHLY